MSVDETKDLKSITEILGAGSSLHTTRLGIPQLLAVRYSDNLVKVIIDKKIKFPVL